MHLKIKNDNMDISFSDDDFEQIKKQFLLALRNKKSQNWMSQRLGYTYNQYGKWESNFKKLNWSDFTEICLLRKIPLYREITKVYNISLAEKQLHGSNLLSAIMRGFFSNNPVKLAKFLKTSSSTLKRWLQRKQEIPIEIIFHALSYRPQLFLLFIYSLNLIKIPEKFEQHLNMYLELYSTESLFPYISGIQAYINTEEYKLQKTHSHEKIAKKLNLSEEQIQKGIELLLKNKAITYVNNKYVLNLTGVEQKGIPNSDLIRSLRYWNYKSLCFLEKKATGQVPLSPRNLSGYRVVAISKDLSNKIAEKLAETYADISRMILEDESSPEIVRVLTINFFNLTDAPQADYEVDSELGLRPKNISE